MSATAGIGSKVWCDSKKANFYERQHGGSKVGELNPQQQLVALEALFGSFDPHPLRSSIPLCQKPAAIIQDKKPGVQKIVSAGVDYGIPVGAAAVSTATVGVFLTVLFGPVFGLPVGLAGGFFAGVIGRQLIRGDIQRVRHMERLSLLITWLDELLSEKKGMHISDLPSLTGTSTIKGIQASHVTASIMKGVLPFDGKHSWQTPFVSFKTSDGKIFVIYLSLDQGCWVVKPIQGKVPLTQVFEWTFPKFVSILDTVSV